MTLSSKAKGLVAAIIVIWLIVIAGLTVSAALTRSGDNSTAPEAGALELSVAGVEGLGLNVTAVALADIYGEEYPAAAILCGGETAESIAANYGIDETELAPLELDGQGIPTGVSYIALMKADGSVDFDKIDSAKVELCLQPLTGLFDTRSMIPLAKVEPGLWALFI